MNHNGKNETGSNTYGCSLLLGSWMGFGAAFTNSSTGVIIMIISGLNV